jgi:hypothetical protein
MITTGLSSKYSDKTWIKLPNWISKIRSCFFNQVFTFYHWNIPAAAQRRYWVTTITWQDSATHLFFNNRTKYSNFLKLRVENFNPMRRNSEKLACVEIRYSNFIHSNFIHYFFFSYFIMIPIVWFQHIIYSKGKQI